MQDIIRPLKSALQQAEAGLEVAVGRLAKDDTDRGDFKPSEVLALASVREALDVSLTQLERLLRAALADTPAAAAPDMVSVKKVDANNYCRILAALGMEDEGDPVAEVQNLLAGVSAPAAQAVLDYPWRDRLLSGQNLARDEMGFAWHPELPQLDEGMKPRAFFAALGIELQHTMAEDDVEWEALDAMSDSANWSTWTPQSPSGEAWKLVAIFDTEDGPAAWWMRELHATHEEMPQAQVDARYAQLLAFVLSEIRRDGMDELSAALHDEDGFPLDHEKGVAAIDRAAIAAQAAQQTQGGE